MSEAGTNVPPLAERLEALRERGRRIEADFAARLADVEAKIAGAVPPNPASARVDIDDRGFPVALELVDASGQATPDQLRAALTTAFAAARTVGSPMSTESAERFAAVFSSIAADPATAAQRFADEAVTVSNDLGQTHVTALFGDVTAVDAQDAWLTNSRTHDIASEILALAQRAALASDRFGRFTEKEDGNG